MSSTKFHAHLDVCKRCDGEPFNLCAEGRRLIRDAVLDVGLPGDVVYVPATPLADRVEALERDMVDVNPGGGVAATARAADRIHVELGPVDFRSVLVLVGGRFERVATDEMPTRLLEFDSVFARLQVGRIYADANRAGAALTCGDFIAGDRVEWFCTRPERHDGAHAAGACAGEVGAIWPLQAKAQADGDPGYDDEPWGRR